MALVPSAHRTPDTELRSGFARQRRSLIVVSAGLVLLLATGANLERVNLLGLEFQLDRPWAVAVVLWITWFYFGLRFVQYRRDLKDAGPREAFMWRLNYQMRRRAVRDLGVCFPDWNAPADEALNPDSHYDSVISYGDPFGVWTVSLRGPFGAAIPGASIQALSAERQDLKFTTTAGDRRKAWFWVAFRTRYFTEYWLPLVVSIIPIIVGLAVLTAH